jgi:hypothetical protein
MERSGVECALAVDLLGYHCQWGAEATAWRSVIVMTSP